MQQQTGSARSYELLLIAVIAARATSFIFSKMILESLAPFNLLAVPTGVSWLLWWPISMQTSLCRYFSRINTL